MKTTQTALHQMDWMTMTPQTVIVSLSCQTVWMKKKSASLLVSQPHHPILVSHSTLVLGPSVSQMMTVCSNSTLYTVIAALKYNLPPCSTATSVTIGLQKTSYSVYETDEYQVVCAEVLSGDIAGRSIDISYITESDTAEGEYHQYVWQGCVATQKKSLVIVMTLPLQTACD